MRLGWLMTRNPVDRACVAGFFSRSTACTWCSHARGAARWLPHTLLVVLGALFVWRDVCSSSRLIPWLGETHNQEKWPHTLIRF